MICSGKFSIEKITPVEEDSIEKPLILILALKFWLSKISRKLLPKLIHLDNRNDVSQSHHPWFLSWGSQSATLHSEKRIRSKFQSAGFFCIKLRQLPKTESLLTFVDIQFHNSPQLQGYFFRQGVNQRLENCSVGFI